MRWRITTADGKTVSIILSPDKKTLKANKQDLSYVSVQVLNASNIAVYLQRKQDRSMAAKMSCYLFDRRRRSEIQKFQISAIRINMGCIY